MNDINGAQKRLPEKLGTVPYPYGEYNLELMKIVEDLAIPVSASSLEK